MIAPKCHSQGNLMASERMADYLRVAWRPIYNSFKIPFRGTDVRTGICHEAAIRYSRVTLPFNSCSRVQRHRLNVAVYFVSVQNFKHSHPSVSFKTKQPQVTCMACVELEGVEPSSLTPILRTNSKLVGKAGVEPTTNLITINLR